MGAAHSRAYIEIDVTLLAQEQELSLTKPSLVHQRWRTPDYQTALQIPFVCALRLYIQVATNAQTSTLFSSANMMMAGFRAK